MVDKEVALKDVEAWLDYKKVRPSVKRDNKGAIENIASYIEDGLLVLEEDYSWKYQLQFPVETEDHKTEYLTFKPRMKVSGLKNGMNNTNTSNPMTMLIGIASELTGQHRAFFDHLEDSDWGLIQNIALFFVPR